MNDFAHARLAEDEPRNPFDLKVLVLYGLVRFRKQIIALAVLGAILGLIAGAAQPNSYSVSAKFRYEMSARQALTDEMAYGVEMGEYRGAMSAAIAEEIQLLRDPVIYERVVDVFGPTKILTVADPRDGDGAGTSPIVKFMHSLQAGLIHLKGLDDPTPDGDTQEARDGALKRLMANTTVKDARGTTLIVVTYNDSSPAKAKLIGDEIIKQMRARHMEEFAASAPLKELKQHKNDLEQQLHKDRSDWNDFKEQCGFWDLDADFAECQEQIRIKERQEAELELQRQNLIGRVSLFKSHLGGGEELAEDGPGEKRLNAEYLMALNTINEKQRELSQLKLIVSPGKWTLDDIEQLENEIEIHREQLDRMPKYSDASSLMGLTADTNDAITETTTMLTTSEGDLKGVVAQLEELREQLDELKRKRQTMEECRQEHKRFEAVVSAAERQLATIRASEGTLSSLAVMDSEERSNLSVFLGTRLPKDKDGPQRSKPLIMGLVAGAALGMGLAVLRQLLDRKVRYQETIENALGLRVLCVVPELAGQSAFRGAKGAA